MSNDAVTELTKDPHTQGKIKAFRQVVGTVEDQQKAIPEKITFNDGGRTGCADCSKVIQEYIALMIKNDRKANVDPEITKQKRELILDVKRNVEKVGQEYLQEHLMLKGEARMLIAQLESIEKLHKAALVEERTKQTLQSQQDAIREAQGRGEKEPLKEEPEESTKTVKKTKKTRQVKGSGKKPRKTRKVVKSD